MRTDFAVFILSHGRPDHVVTYDTLRNGGYTGRLYVIVDNEDTHLSGYYAQFGEQVIVFDKAAIAATFDEGDNFGDRRAVIYARNACFTLAEQLGITYFLELDDDYQEFRYHFDHKNNRVLHHPQMPVGNLDKLFATMLSFYKTLTAKSIAFMQTGDLLGGIHGGYSKSIRVYRKAMNTFFCSTARPFAFVGRINEDVNTYTWFQSLGNLFFSINNIVILQHTTQQQAGGMTELYLDSGTYVKSFYTVMYQPSSVKITLMASRQPRLHHVINWACTVPCILAETYRKSDVSQALMLAGAEPQRVG